MIVAALLLKDEAGPDRYLRTVLDNCKSLCDEIVVVDDHSTDDTAKVCREYTPYVSQASGASPFWGKDETSARSHLWALAAKVAGPDGWIYCCDGDHELLGVSREDMKTLCSAEDVQGWATVLWDAWDSPDTHRIDGYWQAWRSPRPWLVRAFPQPGFIPQWNTRDIHAGHLPANWHGDIGVLPPPIGIRHYGYVRREHREAKARKYLALA